MPESVSVITVIAQWLAKKTADAAWKQIQLYCKPDRLIKEIDSALKSDPEVIQPHPTLDRERLNAEVVDELLRTAVTQDTGSLARYLMEKQLIDLPLKPNKKPEAYEAVWSCIAKTIVKAVCIAITEDDNLSRQLGIIAHQHGHLDHQRILTELQAFRTQLDEKGEQLQRIENSLSHKIESIQTSVFTENTGISDSAANRCINLLSEQNEQLDQKLRDQMDEKTERLWELVLNEIQNQNYRNAIKKGQELSDWLDTESEHLSSSVLGRAFLLLAQVALIESMEWSDLQDDYTKSRELYEKALAELKDDNSDEINLRLSIFKAKLMFLDGRAEEALTLLGTATDPQSLTTRLLILIDEQEYEKGAKLVRDLQIDEKWCEQAVFVYARTGDDEQAIASLTWAKEHGDSVLERRCRLSIAKATLSRLKATQDDSILSVLSMDDDAKKSIESVLACLSPIVEECRARQCIETGIEADAIGFAYSCCNLIGHFNEARSNAELLRDYRPVHLAYADAVIRCDVDFDADIAMRLREDYTNLFLARKMAFVIDIHANLESNEILDRAEELEKLANTNDAREELARMVVQISTTADYEVNERARAITEQLVGHDHFLVRLCESHRWLLDDNIEKFEQSLSTLEENKDYLLDQFRAQLFLKQGQQARAAELLMNVGRDMTEPDLLKDAAGFAIEAKPRRLDLALSALEAALAINPDDLHANRMMAYVNIQLQGFANAAECFARMRLIAPDDPLHALNQAQCCALANLPDDSLKIYDELCSKPEAPTKAHLARAFLLSKLGKPILAFSKLHNIREQHWDEPAFVASYMSMAHAANQDKYAHEGFQRLWELQESGKTSEEFLQPKSLEDLIQFGEVRRKQRNFLLDQSIVGKLPWLFVESLVQNVPYWGWRIRTQSMPWFFDNVHNRASFSIYVTNSYAVFLDEDNRKTIKRIKCSPQRETVVVDLSALITLHRLGLLDKSIEYFGQIKIPPSYLIDVLEHSGKLQPHQLSQKTSLEAIKIAIEAQRVHISDDNDIALVVDEYCDDNEPTCYKIKDLLNALRNGRISQSLMDEVLCVAHKPAMASELGKELKFSDHLIVDLLTLQTLTNQGLLDILSDSFDRVSISNLDYERITQGLRGFDLGYETRVWHEDMWEIINRDDRVDAKTLILDVPEAAEEIDGSEESEYEANRFSVIDASLLAQQEKLPLLIDDRVCQNMVLRSAPHLSSSAFSTDCLILGMLESKLIDQTQAARAFLQLIEWRYRFLVIPHTLLKTIYDEFADQDLHKVAWYLHDCMRDAGLFGGLEKTDPPLPIALRYHQDWLSVIGKFVVEIWRDESVNAERAEEITNWAMKELVPNIPAVMGGPIGRIAKLSDYTVLYHAMIQLIEISDYTKANKILRTIAVGLDLDDQDYILAANYIIENSWPALYDGQEKIEKGAIRAIQSRILRHAFDHVPEVLDSRTAIMMIKNELVESIPQNSIPEKLIAIIENPKHEERWPDSYGPFILFQEEDKKRGVIELSKVFINPEIRIRSAALSELDHQDLQYDKHGLFMSPQSKQRINELRSTVLLNDLQESLSASIEINDILEDDFFFQLAGLRQSLQFRLINELPDLIKLLLEPTQRTIQFLEDLPIWSPLRQQAEIEHHRNHIVERIDTFPKALCEYYRLFGHLPLAGSFSAAGVIGSWVSNHQLPENPWEQIWDWANLNGSPLASYHACQLLCQNPSWIPEEYQQEFISAIVDIALGAENNEHWKSRCSLGRHYCRHLESLDSGADSGRIAAFSWWLAETLAGTIDNYDSETREICYSFIEDEFEKSREIQTVVRLPVSISPLRCMTHCSISIWSTSILCELFNSKILEYYDQDANVVVALKNIFCNVSLVPLNSRSGEFAFEYSYTLFKEIYSNEFLNSNDKSKVSIYSTLIEARTGHGLKRLLTDLPTAEENIAMVTVNELRLQSYNGDSPCDVLFDLFSDEVWRDAVLVDQNEVFVELLCSAAIEVAMHDAEHDWLMYLPHFLASGCEKAHSSDSKRHLFGYTVVSSLASNSVSAIERLLKGSTRRAYEEYVNEWRQRIENLSPIAPAWIRAKLRAIKSVLYIG